MGRWLLIVSLLGTVGCGREIRIACGSAFGFFHDLCVPPDKFDLGPGRADVRGVRVNGAIVWMVPVDGGVALVDTGFDESGAILERALVEQQVQGILLTHAHIDHISGAALFGEAPVFVSALDQPALADAGAAGSFWVAAMEVPIGRPPRPVNLHTVLDDDTVTIGSAEFRAVLTPGHTPGHTVWAFQDLLFIGDVLPMRQTDGGEIRFAQPPADRTDALANLERLETLAPVEMLDGHNGRIDDPETAFFTAHRDFDDERSGG